MSVIALKDISKSYVTNVILKNITFTLNENDKVGLVGINGAGKTTLFKIISGSLQPDSGELFITKDKKIGYLSQNLDLSDNSTIFEETMKVFSYVKEIENRLRELEQMMSESSGSDDKNHENLLKEYGALHDEYESLNGYSCESFAKGILIGLGIKPEDFDKEIVYLSGGQKTRVALAKLLLRNPDILLLDEPTNHLDLDAISFLENFLKEYKGTIIIISHDRYFLDVITTKTFELTQGMIEEFNGNYSYFIAERDVRYEQRIKDYDLQQKEIKRLEEIIERYRSFNREKSIIQAESREKALARIDRIEKPDIDNRKAKIDFDIKFKSGNDVLVVENLSKAYGSNKLFENLNFMIRREEKTALIGENGKGKTTIFKIICKQVEADNGAAILGKNVQIGYYDQEQKDLSSDKTIIDEIWDEYPNMTMTEVRNSLAAFLFKGEDVFKNISSLSGGEKCRLSLLKVILSKSNFLLLDEPTNHLDVLSREALEDALIDYNGTLLVISHDRYFLNKVIYRILELNKDGLTEYQGNYQYYIDRKNAPEDEIIVSTAGKTKTEVKIERRKLREEQEKEKQIQKQIKDIEKQIQETEAKIHDLEELMCLEENYSNPEKSIEINSKLESNKNMLDSLYEKWEELLSY